MPNEQSRRQWWNPIWVWQALVKAALLITWRWFLSWLLKAWGPWLLAAMLGALLWLGQFVGLSSEWVKAGGISFLLCLSAAAFTLLIGRKKSHQGQVKLADPRPDHVGFLRASVGRERERVRVCALLKDLPRGQWRVLAQLAREGPTSLDVGSFDVQNLVHGRLIEALGPGGIMEKVYRLHPDAREIVIDAIARGRHLRS
jgi:hypothetical protein